MKQIPFKAITFIPAGKIVAPKTKSEKDIEDPSHPSNIYSSIIATISDPVFDSSIKRTLRANREKLDSAFQAYMSFKAMDSNMVLIQDSGKNCAALDNLSKYSEIDSDEEKDNVFRLSTEKSFSQKVYFCEICDKQIDEKSYGSHETNLPHLMSIDEWKKKKGYFDNFKPPLVYSVKPDNIGYKLLVKNGWQHSTGLGPSHSGRPLPIPTRIKLDRRGIGMKHISKRKLDHSDKDVKDAKFILNISGGISDKIVKIYGKKEMIKINKNDNLHRKQLLKYLKDS
ncbi:G patch domain and ankyrin repeat-containing protein 1 [Nowakowskiella sp. JEL0078]|nr:G patch domain and ankyrin repeat-containing protein 1 [Nowakowskiella sp. JEL0078]